MDLALPLATHQQHMLSGARAEPGGLHWGHVYGALAGVDLPALLAFYFVVSDTISGTDDIHHHTIDLARDFLAWAGPSHNIHVVRESAIRCELDPIVREIERQVPRSWLEKCHPHRQQLSSGAYKGSIGDYWFPVHQAAFTLGLGVSTVCFNDDNAFVTSFARDVGRRISNNGDGLFSPRLIQRWPGHLIGANGLRMAKANQNTLSICADEPAIRRFVGRLVGLGVGTGDPEDSLASPAEVALADLAGLRPGDLGRSSARARAEVLSSSMADRAREVRRARSELSGAYVEQMLHSGAAHALDRIREVIAQWVV